MYADGDGVPQNDAEAIKWFRMAAEQGDAGAQVNLGLSYENGDGVPRDDILAFSWFSIAATNGFERSRAGLERLTSIMSADQIAEARRISRAFRPKSECAFDSPPK